jgi:TAT (twin-arginine translocation) pathway signal sequence
MHHSDVSRRDFIKLAAATGAALAVPSLGEAAVSTGDKMVGIQIGAISFVDEGTEKVLDILQERGGVNTLFLAVFTYGRGIAGRQIPGYPLPDHGKQVYDLNYHGGNFATPHPQYYKDTVIQPEHAPDHGNLDILAEVLPAAKKRGMKVICWMEDVFRKDLPNIEQVQERDLYGRNQETLCVNNPNYRNFFAGLVEDFARSYDVDGIMWGSERQGALCDSLGGLMTHHRLILAKSPVFANSVTRQPENVESTPIARDRDFLNWKNLCAPRETASDRQTGISFNSGESSCDIPN